MRKFLITNPKKFSGTAEIWYSGTGILCRIDLEQTSMNENTVHHFKNIIPSSIDKFTTGSVFSTDTTVVEADFTVTFEMFWDAYKKKIKAVRCRPLWAKLSKTEQVQAYYGIKKYDKYLQKEAWRMKADPETYLRNKYWENEYR